jgi:catechol 2,3-dioxygenase-like lactoylglutathione lyase family enzyme
VPELGPIYETVLYTDDLAAAEGFYAGVLGLPVVFRSELLLSLRCGDGVLLVFDRTASGRGDRGAPSHGAAGPGHVAFATPAGDMEAWRDHLRRHGVAIESEVRWPGGGLSIYFRDPAGNSLELAPAGLW